MAATMRIYNAFIDGVARGTIDLDAISVKVMLLANAYTFSQSHDFRNDLTNEVTGTGYTTGGASVSVTVTTDGAGNRTRLTLGAAVFDATGGSLSGRVAVYSVDRGGLSSADNLICEVRESADMTATNDTFTIPAQGPIDLTNQNP
jgi:hypothetical protein